MFAAYESEAKQCRLLWYIGSMKTKSLDHHPASRVRQQLLLAAIAALVALAFFLLTPGRSITERLSMATAYAGLIFLAAVLSIGPMNVLRSAPNPLSTYLRRDIGIVAGVLALTHTIIGLLVHFKGDFVQYFFYRTPVGIGTLRYDPFGVANDLGLVAALVVLVLLTISNNLSIRTLGPAQWKGIQRWNYVGAILVIVHGLLYQVVVESRAPAFVACVLVVAAATMIVQLLGYRRRKKQLEQFDSPGTGAWSE
jgi:methionine sulfoxide reductase heme-binding subunit